MGFPPCCSDSLIIWQFCQSQPRRVYNEVTDLEGGWETNVNSKTGWKGNVYLYITVSYPDAFLHMAYNVDLVRGSEKKAGGIASGRGLTCAGIKQGDVYSLVTQPGEKTRFQPFEVKPVPELMASFKLSGNKLTLDMVKSAKSFLPRSLEEVGHDWTNSEWTRTDRKQSKGIK
jgi:hypothetical protein